jgi:predicted kinase
VGTGTPPTGTSTLADALAQRRAATVEGEPAPPEAVLLIGLQGSGKSTFYRERFFATHVRINLDMLRTRRRETLLLDACLKGGTPFVVDNTNATLAVRARYLTLARAAGFRCVGYFLDVPIALCLARNAARPTGQRVPPIGIYGTRKRLQPPTPEEGFDALYRVTIADDGALVVADWPR